MKEKLENCIRLTNEVVYRWYTQGRVKKHQISKEEVYGVFLQYIHKYIVKDDIDFKKFRKVIKITLNNESLFIDSLYLIPNLDYYREGFTIEQIKIAISTVNFEICEPHKSELGSISFSSIINIKF